MDKAADIFMDRISNVNSSLKLGEKAQTAEEFYEMEFVGMSAAKRKLVAAEVVNEIKSRQVALKTEEVARRALDALG